MYNKQCKDDLKYTGGHTNCMPMLCCFVLRTGGSADLEISEEWEESTEDTKGQMDCIRTHLCPKFPSLHFIHLTLAPGWSRAVLTRPCPLPSPTARLRPPLWALAQALWLLPSGIQAILQGLAGASCKPAPRPPQTRPLAPRHVFSTAPLP